jgi:hypothetical protein
MGDELSEVLQRAIEKYGVKKVAALLHLSAEATCRLAGRLKTQRGTKAQAEANLWRIAELDRAA